MKTKNNLYLASDSQSRKRLLSEAGISFEVINQNADENRCDFNQLIEKIVEEIAVLKMEHIQLDNINKEEVFVLTADTLTISQNSFQNGKIYGKPKDYKAAVQQIKELQNGSIVASGFCLDKKVFRDGKFSTESRIIKSVLSHVLVEVPDNYIEKYIEKCDALKLAGALSVDGYGALFTKSIKGSYTNIIGLPMYELHQALEKIGFYS